MSNPNSLLTRIRTWLAGKLQPQPDAGEMWCMKCSLTERHRSLVLPADSLDLHIRSHLEATGLPPSMTVRRTRRVAI